MKTLRLTPKCRGNIFPVLVASSIVLFSLNSSTQAQSSEKKWVGTWACAPYSTTDKNPPTSSLNNNTFRQIVRVSIGGDTLRVKFSNITCANAVTIKSANIAVSPDGTKSAIDASTKKELTFNNNADVTINAKSEVYSDPVAFDLKPSQRIAITIYYGNCQTSSDMTFHYGSRTNSYLLTGDKTSSADFSGATAMERWFTISSIDVLAPKKAAAVAVIGNSITDGYGLSGGLQNRWTDAFSEKLLANQATQQVGVLNLGIGATLVTSASNGASSGVDRFKHDVLTQSGVKWVVIFYGVNDINANVSAGGIEDGIKKMIADVREKDNTIKVYGATLTPFKGNSYFSDAHEAIRRDLNKWIRTPGSFDGFLDFDKVVRDPNDTLAYLAKYKNDGLHPNAEGYKAIGQSIDVNLFTDIEATDHSANQKSYTKENMNVNYCNGNTIIQFEIPHESFVSLRVYSLLGKELSELAGKNFSSGKHTMVVKDKTIPKGMYVYSLKADEFSASRIMIH